MSYRIIPQEESVGRGQTQEVLCKHLKFFPVKAKKSRKRVEDDTQGFGRFSFIILKMILAHDNGQQAFITWSNKGGKGKFIYHYPDRMVYPTYKAANGRVYEDTLSPKVCKPGETKEFYDHNAFADFLMKQVGDDLTVQIVQEFANKLARVA
jgi:hypothetical protein